MTMVLYCTGVVWYFGISGWI